MACKRSAVRSRLPPPANRRKKFSSTGRFFRPQEATAIVASDDSARRPRETVRTVRRVWATQRCRAQQIAGSFFGSPSSRGLGHRHFTAITGVRIPVGTPPLPVVARAATQLCRRGVVVQSVRIPACHAGGRGFESRPLRHQQEAQRQALGFFVSAMRAAALRCAITHTVAFRKLLSIPIWPSSRNIGACPTPGTVASCAFGPRLPISAWVSAVSKSDVSPRVTSVGQRIAS